MSPTPRNWVLKSFDFCIEGFRRCVCESPFEIVYYCGVVVLESLQYFVEFIISERFHFIVPSGEFQSGDSGRKFSRWIYPQALETAHMPFQIGNFVNNIRARILCWSFHFDLCLSMICRLRAMICGIVSPFSILSGSHCPIRSRSSFDFAPLRFRRCSLIALFSTSRTSQRCRILSWSTASEMSCWTWNRSLTSYAPGNTFLTSKHHGRRKICRDGFTLRRCFNGTFLSIADTVSLAATNHRRKSPLPPRAALLVRIV